MDAPSKIISITTGLFKGTAIINQVPVCLVCLQYEDNRPEYNEIIKKETEGFYG